MAKRNCKQKEEMPKDISFALGHEEDGFEHLQYLCNEKMSELITAINDLEAGKTIPVTFWTEGFCSELIGVGSISKNAENKLEYTLSFDESTL